MSTGSLLGRLAATMFGGSCYVCRGAASRGALICVACERDLPVLARECCPRCALPAADGQVCGRCLAEPPGFDATVAAFAYAFPVDVMVKALKFASELALAPYLAGHLADTLAGAGAAGRAVDLIIAVPLHPQRLAERGYNQSVEIARVLSRGTGTPLASAGCERLRDTPAQAELPLDARARNMRGAFACSLDLAGRRVALVDDVMTTGATLDALAAVVKRAGALSVANWVVARTL
jgi:ComF family protein